MQSQPALEHSERKVSCYQASLDTSLSICAQTMQRKSMYEAEVSNDQNCYEAILEQARSLQRAEIKRYSQSRSVCRC
jgi:hypothetical protein